MRIRLLRLPALLFALAAGFPVDAQEAKLRRSRAPHYVDRPVVLLVEATGFGEDPVPTCEPGEISGGELTFLGAEAPSRSSSMVIINGQVQRTDRITYAFRYTFNSDAPGRFRIAPFTVNQGSVERRTQAITLTLETIPVSDDVGIRLLLPDKPVYVGQRVPVEVEWRYAGRARNIRRDETGFFRTEENDLSKARIWIQSKLFTLDEAFSFNDPRIGRRDFVLPIVTSAGRQLLKAKAETQSINTRQHLVYTAKRTLVPLRPGEYDLGPTTVSVERVTRWTSGMRSQPATVEQIRNSDIARKLVVKEPPLTGRPASYAGAVGRGFTIDVTADRSVVRVGDPIKLNITLSGDGNLENAGLPPLDADGGLSREAFRIPTTQMAGIFQKKAGKKTFDVSVRVSSDSVRGIPPISYSWFDPEDEQYRTAQSQPIALSVSAGDVVSSDDVESTADRPDGDRDKTAPSAARPRFALPDADFSITVDGDRALAPGSRELGGKPAVAALYGFSFLLLALAIVGRVRAAVDPALVRRRRALQEAHAKIVAARGRSRVEGTAQIAGGLRTFAAEGCSAPGLDDLLAECEAVVYAPESAQDELDRGFHERAVALADRLLAGAR